MHSDVSARGLLLSSVGDPDTFPQKVALATYGAVIMTQHSRPSARGTRLQSATGAVEPLGVGLAPDGIGS